MANLMVDPQPDRPKTYFDLTMVVTRGPDGKPLSRFSADVWDFSGSAKGRSKRLYHDCPDLAIRLQGKATLWAYIGLHGRAVAFGTIYSKHVTLRKWIKAALQNKISLFDILTSEQHITEFLKTNSGDIKHTIQLVKAVYKHRKEFDVSFDAYALLDVLKRKLVKIEEPSQTLLMPQQVYSSVLGSLSGALSSIEKTADRLLLAFTRCAQVAGAIPADLCRKKRGELRRIAAPEAYDIAAEHGYTHEDNGPNVLNFLRGKIRDIQVALVALVLAFSGMRLGEALNLPRDCLCSFVEKSREHWIISGFTYKLEQGETVTTTWITSELGRRAIQVAQTVSAAISRCSSGNGKDRDYPLLFCSTASDFRILPGKWQKSWDKTCLTICPEITAADMKELEWIEPSRDFSADGVVIGARWPLRPHQFRRALAVYAHRSGMVTVPSLKGQLKHISDEMTLYYAQGFQKAASLVFDPQHFSHVWDAAASESSYYGYALGVLLNEDNVLGGAAVWARSESVRSSPVSVHSRQHAMEMFRKGQIAYRETTLGGCTSTEGCTSNPTTPIQYECLESNCKDLAVFGRRLTRVIESQQAVVIALATQNEGSVEHRLEADNLASLLRARTRLKEAPPIV